MATPSERVRSRPAVVASRLATVGRVDEPLSPVARTRRACPRPRRFGGAYPRGFRPCAAATSPIPVASPILVPDLGVSSAERKFDALRASLPQRNPELRSHQPKNSQRTICDARKTT